MDMTKYAKSSVTVDVAKSSPSKKLVILNAGSPRVMPDGKEKPTFLVEMDGRQLEWTPNKTTVKNLLNAFGSDSEKYVGKAINLEIQTINNKEAIIAKPQSS